MCGLRTKIREAKIYHRFDSLRLCWERRKSGLNREEKTGRRDRREGEKPGIENEGVVPK